MERLRLTSKEKTRLIEAFTAEVEGADKLSAINFSPKGLIDELDKTGIIKPTIIIDLEVMHKMQALVDESAVEISWHGFVKRNKDKSLYYVYDIAVFPQINTSTTTTTDQDEYTEWITKYIIDPNSDFENMRLHGHSHVNMGVFSSGVDDQYQKDLIKNTKDGDFYIFLILNKKREICTLLYDFNQQILFRNNDITLTVLDKDGKNPNDWAKEIIKEYCTYPEPKYSPYRNGYNTYGAAYSETPQSQVTPTRSKANMNNAKRKGIFKR